VGSAAFASDRAQEVVEQEQGELSLPERLRWRIRYFSDGVILGQSLLCGNAMGAILLHRRV
jgi:hypothetical protein